MPAISSPFTADLCRAPTVIVYVLPAIGLARPLISSTKAQTSSAPPLIQPDKGLIQNKQVGIFP